MPRKKTAETIRQEVARQIDQLLRVIFQERHKTGGLDLEATEMAMRSALHHAGAIETVEEFGMRIHLEAWKGGWSRAKKKSRDGGRSRMDLESGRSILSRPDPDCRSVSRSPAPLGTGPQATPQRREHSEPLELDNCKINKLVTYLRSTQTPSVELAENFGPRRSTFAGTRGAAVSQIPPATPIRGHGSHRSRNRFPLQAAGHVLDRAWRQCDPGFALLSVQRRV